MTNSITINLKEVVGKGYKDIWNYKGRYLALKGGRASKKSKTIALRWITKLMKHPDANLLVVRQVFYTHRDSTFADLKWATHRLKVSHLWRFKTSPLEATYKPTGQKILFRGLDNPLSITSITVEKGYLCWAWFEEAYQIRSEEDFNKVDMSIRGDTGGLFKQIVLSFNPWNEKHWLKPRFFDVKSSNILAVTTNYLCNEFLDDQDKELFEWMKEHRPRRYNVEGLGEWGIAEGIIFDNWKELDFDYEKISKLSIYEPINGLDFGFTNDPTAFINAIASKEEKKIYVYDEHYEKGMTNDEIARMIKEKGYSKSKIIADSAEPKSIEEIKRAGIRRIKEAVKGPDSVRAGVQMLLDYEIIVHPRCQNFQIELSNYTWDSAKDGTLLNKPIDDFNHLIDALRYGMQSLGKTKAKAVPSLY
ncbi:PBSX family phage terminase large subunit [Heyndrickxia sporothermodurans]|uniref:PBSX family phage terminase large subunit n=1 Tax=Heyndrickxia sporothermodurans TaxID=46224 RepID=A0AB37HKS0_9BACI|nr:PBSX family phage terminase large subunit [Heyndrickxia sporothermodurans]MBL5768402.1 PBSX family phage terminase large subunit [Heyndrickxia sporothermodurans]MBL5771033.1 PBSX family phage terminase large subunit [Heyndrickxia sporothermodurans]MBL5774671.1 PBSX family phage terminase large subunit [Heyndrickxia sporothermodurans]MBL5778135.1 PBSX family phage terminase large subunit [Heyndrickxia sporothermodurans]MBL5785408.1 PBSX family phage terminase large subunit [Heyndrickxia spor